MDMGVAVRLGHHRPSGKPPGRMDSYFLLVLAMKASMILADSGTAFL